MATRSGKIPFSAAFGNSQSLDFLHFSNEGGKKGDTNGREVVIMADGLCTSRGADQRRGIKIQQKKKSRLISLKAPAWPLNHPHITP